MTNNDTVSFNKLSRGARELLDRISAIDDSRINPPVKEPETDEQIPSYYIHPELNLNYYEVMENYRQKAISDEHRIDLLEEYVEDLGWALCALKERLDNVDKSKEVQQTST